MTEVLCGECGAEMRLRETTKYLNKEGNPTKFYGCSKYPECKGTHSAHQRSGDPMGIPANKETKAWRIKAHTEFDKLWQKYGYNRKESYELLKTIMNLDKGNGHIGMFDIDQCKLLIKKLKAYKKKE